MIHYPCFPYFYINPLLFVLNCSCNIECSYFCFRVKWTYSIMKCCLKSLLMIFLPRKKHCGMHVNVPNAQLFIDNCETGEPSLFVQWAVHCLLLGYLLEPPFVFPAASNCRISKRDFRNDTVVFCAHAHYSCLLLPLCYFFHGVWWQEYIQQTLPFQCSKSV